MSRILKINLGLYLILIFFSFRSLVHGEATFRVTIAIYATMFAVTYFFESVIKHAFSNSSITKERIRNVHLALYSVIFTLMFSDLVLLYIIRPANYLTYTERNGEHHYHSTTLRQKFEKLRPYLHSSYRMRWPFTNKPGKDKHLGEYEFTNLHRYNRDGLRGRNLTEQKKPAEIRVLSLGDSFTEGVGAPEDSTWGALLEDLLQTKKSDTTYTVINAGVSGSDPFFESNLLETRLLKYHPDVVIMAINRSDIDDVMQRGGYERFRKDSTYVIKNSPWWEPFYGASMLCRMYTQNVLDYTHYLMTAETEQVLRSQSAKQLTEAINKTISLSEKHRFKLVFVFHPMLLELEQDSFSLSAVSKGIRENSNVSVVNLFDDYKTFFFANKLQPKDYYWEKDLHHNSRGYALWSRLLYEKLLEKKILD